MPTNYDVLDNQQTIQVVGGTVNDVVLVTIATKPTGVQATVSVVAETWVSGSASGLLDLTATQIEGLVTDHHVIGGNPAEDLDNNNLLTLYVDLIVRYDRSGSGLPPLDGIARVPVNAFYLADLGIGGYVPPGTVLPGQYVDAEYNRLKALAA